MLLVLFFCLPPALQIKCTGMALQYMKLGFWGGGDSLRGRRLKERDRGGETSALARLTPSPSPFDACHAGRGGN